MSEEVLHGNANMASPVVVPAAFTSALHAWAESIGSENVLSEASQLDSFQKSTIPNPATCSAVLRPDSADQIQEIAAIATRFEIPIYPTSCGKNWGYGDATPTTDQQVIVDLSKMNRIVEVNEKLAYAVIEPGVTQQQLHQHLSQNNIPLWIDPTGAGPHVSILGNALERGFGITPYGDHFATICGLDVVLPSGKLLKTGFGHFDNAKADRCFQHGVGPALDGLFTQSNFGIVTRLGVWLMPRPEHFELCLFSIDKAEQLPDLIEKVRYLKLHQITQGSINLVSRNRALTVIQQYPWHQMGATTPMSEQVAQQIAETRGVGIWNGVCGLYGPKRLVRSQKQIIRRQLRGICGRVNFLSQNTINTVSRFPKIVGLTMGVDVSALLSAIKPAFGLLSGIPSEANLRTAYWRTSVAAPPQDLDPKRDGCGLIWFAPVLPLDFDAVDEFQKIAAPILHKYGFDFCMTLTTVTARAFDCTLPILFDRSNASELAQAQRCYEELFESCASSGFFPYRVHAKSMAALRDRSTTYWEFCDSVKKSIDPRGILAPGRYQPDSCIGDKPQGV